VFVEELKIETLFPITWRLWNYLPTRNVNQLILIAGHTAAIVTF